MATPTITLQGIKPTKLSFTMDISGIADTAKSLAYFVVDDEKVRYCFPCKKKGESWTASIPALPYLEKGTYDGYIEVIVENYYFRPLEVKVKITGAPMVSVSEPVAESAPPKIDVMIVEEEGEEPVKVEEDASGGSTSAGVIAAVPTRLVSEPIKRPTFASVVQDTAAREEAVRRKKRANEKLKKILKDK